jgi:hypothetical protein
MHALLHCLLASAGSARMYSFWRLVACVRGSVIFLKKNRGSTMSNKMFHQSDSSFFPQMLVFH